jgi:hypothetical protein
MNCSEHHSRLRTTHCWQLTTSPSASSHTAKFCLCACMRISSWQQLYYWWHPISCCYIIYYMHMDAP